MAMSLPLKIKRVYHTVFHIFKSGKSEKLSGRKVLAAVLSLAMILTLTNPTTVFAAEKDGTE